MLRQCGFCGVPLHPSRPPWTTWCGGRCRSAAYRRRRQLVARALELRIANLVDKGAEDEAEGLIGLALPSLQSRLRSYLQRRLKAREELEKAAARFDFERWLANRARWLRRTGRIRPPPVDIPPEQEWG